MGSDTLVFENGTDVAVYTPQTKDGLIIGFHQPDGKFSIVQESAAEIAVRSKSAHYSLSGFEGGKVVVHFTEGGKQRLYLFHYDWNAARLVKQNEFWGFGKNGLSVEKHMLALVNILYANGWDANPVMRIDGSGLLTSEMYVRPLLYLPDSDNIRLSNREPFRLMLIVSPEKPYHEGADPAGMAVLHCPQARTLPNPQYKVSENYGISSRWVEWVREEKKFVAWLEKERPEIIVNGQKLTEGQKKAKIEEMRASLQEIIFHNHDGNVCELSAENVAIAEKSYGRIYKARFLTPPIEAGVLPGFTMQIHELIAERLGLEAQRENFTLERLKHSDLALMTGNAAGGVRIKEVAECGWNEVEPGIWVPHGPVQITAVGNEKGLDIFQKMKQEYEKTLQGRSCLGKFGVYADEFLSERDIGRIREATTEAVNTMKKTGMPLVGSIHEGYQSRLEGGRQLRYAGFLRIK